MKEKKLEIRESDSARPCFSVVWVPVPVLRQRTDKGYESSKGRTHIQSDLAVAHQRALGIFSIHAELCDNYNNFCPIVLL